MYWFADPVRTFEIGEESRGFWTQLATSPRWKPVNADQRCTGACVRVNGRLRLGQPKANPLLLQPRTCPPGAYATTTAITGEVSSMVNGQEQRAIFVRTADSPDPAKLVLVGSSVLLSTDAEVIHLGDIQRGDRVDAVGIPSPDRTLVYLAQRVTDLDLTVLHGEQAIVTSWNTESRVLTLRLASGSPMTVVVSRSTPFEGAGPGSGQPQLRRGDIVAVTGVLNTRVRRVVEVTKLQIEPTAS